MTVADEADVTLLLADFANVDAGGKLNVIGGGWQAVGRLPTGMTPPFSVVIRVEFPSARSGEQFAYGLVLHDEHGGTISFPGPSGELQELRIQHLAKAEKPTVPQVALPDHLPSRVQIVINFGGGLLLSPGGYRWQFEVDGNARPEWHLAFAVIGPPPPPVIG